VPRAPFFDLVKKLEKHATVFPAEDFFDKHSVISPVRSKKKNNQNL
jgi:hypothetical protein